MSLPAIAKFARGSEWQKWDLHIHSPASGLNNQFPKLPDGNADWIKYVDALERLKDIPVIGVTDYFLIEGYKKLLEYRQAGRLKNIDLLLPNIELRLDNVVQDKRLNLHVIFSDEISPEQIEDHFLSNIDIVSEGDPWEADKKMKLKRSSLEQLGQRLKKQHSKFTGTDFEVGCTTAVVRVDQIVDLLTTNPNFKDKYLIVLAEENTSLMDWNSQAHNVRKTLLQRANAIFSANPNTIDFCLGKKHPSLPLFLEEFKSQKPCFCGSDGHSLETLGIPENKKYTWIKANCTFNGLLQTIYEPEIRVSIGTSPPNEKDSTKIISSVSISKESAWFGDATIPLSRDMVAIIGGKGSGKTALIDVLGYVGGDYAWGNGNSFLEKAHKELEGAIFRLVWENGDKDEYVFSRKTNLPGLAKVRYLSQSFVESLCSHDQHAKLIAEIESVLFQYVPNDKQLGSEDFHQLRYRITESVQLELDDIDNSLRAINKEIFELGQQIRSKASLTEEKSKLEKERKDLEEQRPKAESPEEQKEQDDLQALRNKKAEFEKQLEQERINLSALELLRTKAVLLKTEIEKFNAAVETTLASMADMEDKDQLLFKSPDTLTVALDNKFAKIKANIQRIQGSAESIPQADAPDTLLSVGRKIEAIEKKSKLEVERKKRILEFGKRIDLISKRIATISETLEQITTTKIPLSKQKLEEREKLIALFFGKLSEKKQKLEELYQPLNEQNADSEERSRVKFHTKFTFDVKRFISEGLKIFDGRKSIVRGEDALAELGETFWQKIQGEQPNVSGAAWQTIAEQLKNGKDIEKQLREEYSLVDVSNWLFTGSYFDIEYGISYEGIDLDKLSPGRKGVVLLMIFLDIDRDFRPLLIDQPEENLDNRSVYTTLVQFFRSAKRKRQIILVTHNANLVVNCDADQIIVANFEVSPLTQASHLKYKTGALEETVPFQSSHPNPLDKQGIKEHVCEILEGGDEAFKKREGKYGL